MYIYVTLYLSFIIRQEQKNNFFHFYILNDKRKEKKTVQLECDCNLKKLCTSEIYIYKYIYLYSSSILIPSSIVIPFHI